MSTKKKKKSTVGSLSAVAWSPLAEWKTFQNSLV